MALRDTLARLIGREDRSVGNYTDQVLYEQYTHARGRNTDAMMTACQNATRITALTMTRGRLELNGTMASYWRDVLTDDFIFQSVYDVLMNGDSVHRIDADDVAAGMLDRASSFEVRGKRRGRYRYQLEIPHPDGQDTRNVSQDDVLHLRLGADRATPWRGRSVFADLLLRAIEKGLVDAARLPVQRIVNYPRSMGAGIDTQGTSGQIAQDDQWSTLLSRSGLMNLTDNTDRRGTPMEIPHVDLQFMPGAQAVELRRDLIRECFQAVGFPVSMLSPEAPGQTVRQEHTRWCVGILQPIADVLAGQLAAALEVEVQWDMKAARIPLVTDQAVAFKNLTSGNMDPDEAKQLVGFME